jgi:hypothetical protein
LLAGLLYLRAGTGLAIVHVARRLIGLRPQYEAVEKSPMDDDRWNRMEKAWHKSIVGTIEAVRLKAARDARKPLPDPVFVAIVERGQGDAVGRFGRIQSVDFRDRDHTVGMLMGDRGDLRFRLLDGQMSGKVSFLADAVGNCLQPG